MSKKIAIIMFALCNFQYSNSMNLERVEDLLAISGEEYEEIERKKLKEIYGERFQEELDVHSRQEVRGVMRSGFFVNPMQEVDSEVGENVLRMAPAGLQRFINYSQQVSFEDSKRKQIILTGEKGCGKTTLAKYIPQKLGWNCVYVNSDLIPNDNRGFYEGKIRMIFDQVRNVDEPYAFIFDGIDRYRTDYVFGDIIDSLDDGDNNILFVGVCNSLGGVSDRVKSRLWSKYHFGLPSFSQRSNLIRFYLKDYNGFSDSSLSFLSFCWGGKNCDEIARQIEEIVKYKKIKNQREETNQLITFDDIRKQGLEMKWPLTKAVANLLREPVIVCGAVSGLAIVEGMINQKLHLETVQLVLQSGGGIADLIVRPAPRANLALVSIPLLIMMAHNNNNNNNNDT